MRFARDVAVATIVLGSLGASSCGGTSSSPGKINPKYAEFCLKSAELDAKSKGTHGEDPAAMSDPSKMSAAWTTITDLAVEFRDTAPDEVKPAVATLVGSILAMNDVYKQYKYNLLEMSHVPAVADSLRTIANADDVVAASKRFRTFMQKNCGEPAA